MGVESLDDTQPEVGKMGAWYVGEWEWLARGFQSSMKGRGQVQGHGQEHQVE